MNAHDYVLRKVVCGVNKSLLHAVTKARNPKCGVGEIRAMPEASSLMHKSWHVFQTAHSRVYRTNLIRVTADTRWPDLIYICSYISSQVLTNRFASISSKMYISVNLHSAILWTSFIACVVCNPITVNIPQSLSKFVATLHL